MSSDSRAASGYVLSMGELGLPLNVTPPGQPMLSLHRSTPPMPALHPPPGALPPASGPSSVVRSVAPGVLTGLPGPSVMFPPTTQEMNASAPSASSGMVTTSSLISASTMGSIAPTAYSAPPTTSIASSLEASAMAAPVPGSDSSASPLPLSDYAFSSASSAPPQSPPDHNLYFNSPSIEGGAGHISQLGTAAELENILDVQGVLNE
jgi:hypothetical protein